LPSRVTCGIRPGLSTSLALAGCSLFRPLLGPLSLTRTQWLVLFSPPPAVFLLLPNFRRARLWARPGRSAPRRALRGFFAGGRRPPTCCSGLPASGLRLALRLWSARPPWLARRGRPGNDLGKNTRSPPPLRFSPFAASCWPVLGFPASPTSRAFGTLAQPIQLVPLSPLSLPFHSPFSLAPKPTHTVETHSKDGPHTSETERRPTCQRSDAIRPTIPN